MAIDNPIEAFEQQYINEGPTLPNKLAKNAAEAGFKLAIPDGGLAAEILVKVADVLFDKPATLSGSASAGSAGYCQWRSAEPHSSLNCRTPAEFAVMSCGKDAGCARLDPPGVSHFPTAPAAAG